MQYIRILSCLVTGLLLAPLSLAKDVIPNAFTEAFKKGSPELGFRLRFEDSKQQYLKDATATTLRSTVGFETAQFSNSTIKVELVDVANFFGRHYNPGVPELAKPQYTLINDPRGAGLTEGKFIYTGLAQNTFMIGRQYIQLDNERFVGKNNLRQYPQSFDAISWNCTMIDTLDAYFAFLTYVNTNVANGRSGGRRKLDTTLINLDWSGSKYGIFAGYVYFNKDESLALNSNTTFGLRFSSPSDLKETDGYGYAIEVARQQAHFGNPYRYVAYYTDIKISKTIDYFTGIAGFERLQGNSGSPNKMFVTPLGSVDNFNGLAQVFSSTPSRGLQDAYLTLSASNTDITAAIIYHYFRFDTGPGARSAGQEIDFTIYFKLNTQVDLNFTFAKYNPQNNAAPRTRRLWVMLTANLL